MKGILIMAMLLMAMPGNSQKKTFPVMYGTYVHPKLDSFIARHHIIAVVGEFGYLTRRVDEQSASMHDSITAKAIKNLGEMVYAAWKANRSSFNVEFQHPDTTYALLGEGGIEPGNLRFADRAKLAAILGVDAVMTFRCLVYKKYYPAEVTMINIASIATTIKLASMGNYTMYFPFKTGTEVFYSSTTIHDAKGDLLYLDKGLDRDYQKLNPGGWKNRKNLRGFPYLAR
jgi:hypothetical protein